MNTLRLPQPLIERMNVSAQPKISPFRYPGGKTRLAELVHVWMLSNSRPSMFIEPFAGGASISLYIAAKNLSRKVKLVEKDDDVASVWQTILSADHEWLCKQVNNFSPTKKTVYQVLQSNKSETKYRAFRTIVRNRMGRSGLLWNGAGLTKTGERGRGLRSRWYASTIVNRIRFIHSLNQKIIFQHGCGLEELKFQAGNKTSSWFIDPPYSIGESSAGVRLYRHNEIDHEQLFNLASNNCSQFLITHENNRQVRMLAKQLSMQVIKLPVFTGNNKNSSELLIGSNLPKMVQMLNKNRIKISEPLSKLDFV